MVANPMQKKARNSFLLGMVITLVVCLIILAVFYFFVISKDKKEKKEEGEKVIAYVLNQDVKSGDIITSNLLTQIEVYNTMIPSNYVDSIQLSNMTLQDNNGNVLYTNSERKMYINQENNTAYLTTEEKNKNERVLIQQDANGFYKTRKDGAREYIELLSVPFIAKINMNANSIVTVDSITKSNELVTDDLRYVEYNMLVLPTTIMEGDYIDIRLTLPNGQDLIVVSKKQVKSILGDTVGLELTESEILMMESAIVEAYIMTASKLYAIQYIEPGMQQAAIKTYVPTNEVLSLIAANPNITDSAKTALINKFIKGEDGTIENGERGYINNARYPYSASEQTNLETGIQEEIENAREAREAYLSGLTSY